MSKRDARLMRSLEAVAQRHKEDAVDKASRRDTTQIYSVIAMAMWELLEVDSDDDRMDMINTLFARSQEIWQEILEKGQDPCRICFLKTGIEIREQHDVEEGKYDGI